MIYVKYQEREEEIMGQMLPDGGRRRYNRGNGRRYQGESGVVVGIAADGAVISSGRC